jgi:hypothetical protein
LPVGDGAPGAGAEEAVDAARVEVEERQVALDRAALVAGESEGFLARRALAVGLGQDRLDALAGLGREAPGGVVLEVVLVGHDGVERDRALPQRVLLSLVGLGVSRGRGASRAGAKTKPRGR